MIGIYNWVHVMFKASANSTGSAKYRAELLKDNSTANVAVRTTAVNTNGTSPASLSPDDINDKLRGRYSKLLVRWTKIPAPDQAAFETQFGPLVVVYATPPGGNTPAAVKAINLLLSIAAINIATVPAAITGLKSSYNSATDGNQAAYNQIIDTIAAEALPN